MLICITAPPFVCIIFRYRVVPACYRRAMPVRLKSHRSHDVVLLCVTCHEAAHAAAERLKRQLADELAVPLMPPPPRRSNACKGGNEEELEELSGQDGTVRGAGEALAVSAAAEQAQLASNMHPFNVRRAALALQRYSAQMPPHKRRQLQDQVRSFLGSRTEAVPAAGRPAGAANACGSPQEQEEEEEAGPPLTHLELCGGLLAGGLQIYFPADAWLERPAHPDTAPPPAATPINAGAALIERRCSPLLLVHVVRAGLGARTRRRALKRWVAEGRQLPRVLATPPPALL
jgi:hypothetical protein